MPLASESDRRTIGFRCAQRNLLTYTYLLVEVIRSSELSSVMVGLGPTTQRPTGYGASGERCLRNFGWGSERILPCPQTSRLQVRGSRSTPRQGATARHDYASNIFGELSCLGTSTRYRLFTPSVGIAVPIFSVCFPSFSSSQWPISPTRSCGRRGRLLEASGRLPPSANGLAEVPLCSAAEWNGGTRRTEAFHPT
jgi:hypothetical protein